MNMRFISVMSVVLTTLLSFTLPTTHAAGLYGDEEKNSASGDLNSQDYWWTKYDVMMLDLAIKEREPEGRIGVDIAITLRRLDDLIKQYPKHEELKKWKEHFQEIEAKIDQNAPRSEAFRPDCPWDESNFAQLWVNVHWAKFAVEKKDWSTARPLVSNIVQNYAIMLKPERMKEYPEELRKWVIDSKPETDKLIAQIKAKNGG